MADPVSPSIYLANRPKPRTQAHFDKENVPTERVARASVEPCEANEDWKLPNFVVGKLVAWSDDDDDDDYDDDRENDTSDSENEAKRKPRATPRETLEMLLNQNGADVASKAAYAEFTTKHYREIGRHIHKDCQGDLKESGTLLHFLARGGAKESWMVWTRFILQAAECMEVPILQKTGRSDNCLHTAIGNGERGLHFIRFVCSIANPANLKSAIGADGAGDLSCIELAISYISIPEPTFPFGNSQLLGLRILQKLIQKAGTETLAKPRTAKMNQSSEGIHNLPLHDLVHINLCRGLCRNCLMDEQHCKRCGKQRAEAEKYHSTYLDVLNDLVQKYPKALKEVNKLKQSPFLFHCHTRNANDTCREWGRLELSTSLDPTRTLMDNQANPTLPVQSLPTNKDVQSFRNAKNSPAPPVAKIKGEEQKSKVHKHPVFEFSKTLATSVSRTLLELCMSQDSFADICKSSFGESKL
jgi:hypothetical protein